MNARNMGAVMAIMIVNTAVSRSSSIRVSPADHFNAWRCCLGQVDSLVFMSWRGLLTDFKLMDVGLNLVSQICDPLI